MSKIIISPMASHQDILGKAYVHYRAWHETYGDLVSPSYLDTITLDRCRAEAYRTQDHHLVAKLQGKMAGFVGFKPCAFPEFKGFGEITGLYVKSEYQGQGIGHALLDAALDQLLDYSQILVWILGGNHQAAAFFQKMGFQLQDASREMDLDGTVTQQCMIYQQKPERLVASALRHLYGTREEEDPELAFQLLYKASQAADPDGTFYLGECFRYGHGTRQDLAKAYANYLLASDLGCRKASVLVGSFYNQGIYVPQDREFANYWLELAENSDDPEAVKMAAQERLWDEDAQTYDQERNEPE